MKYYNFTFTNLGRGWWRWKPRYIKKSRNDMEDKGYFFWLNWRITWWFTTHP